MKTFIGNEKIDLQTTLIDSAQSFFWTKSNDKYGAVINGVPVWVWLEDDCVYSSCHDIDTIRDYLDLNRDYSVIAEEYSKYPLAKSAVNAYPGLRVLNQPVWDTLVSFIISANNNVSRIRSSVMKICAAYGDEHETEFGVLFSCPSPDRLAACTYQELRDFGVGFRDRYLVETSKMVSSGFPIDTLSEMSYDDAHKALTALMGVGDKVADCVQLFSCRQSEAYPVDVWMARATKAVFNIDIDNPKKLGKAARELLGNNAGLLQQFLFHAARMGTLEV